MSADTPRQQSCGSVLRCLGLNLAHEDVLRLGELVLVKRVMLHRGSPSV